LSHVHSPAGHQGQRSQSGRLIFVHGSLETLLTQTIFDVRYANISIFFPLTDTRDWYIFTCWSHIYFIIKQDPEIVKPYVLSNIYAFVYNARTFYNYENVRKCKIYVTHIHEYKQIFKIRFFIIVIVLNIN